MAGGFDLAAIAALRTCLRSDAAVKAGIGLRPQHHLAAVAAVRGRSVDAGALTHDDGLCIGEGRQFAGFALPVATDQNGAAAGSAASVDHGVVPQADLLAAQGDVAAAPACGAAAQCGAADQCQRGALVFGQWRVGWQARCRVVAGLHMHAPAAARATGVEHSVVQAGIFLGDEADAAAVGLCAGGADAAFECDVLRRPHHDGTTGAAAGVE